MESNNSTSTVGAGCSAGDTGHGFTCMTCGGSFSSSSGLGRHRQASGHGAGVEMPTTRERRCRYSFTRKREMLLSVEEKAQELGGDFFSAREFVAKREGLSSSALLRKREEQKEKIFQCARTRRVGGMMSSGIHICDYVHCVNK